jgi:hypothetical protein
VHGARRTSCIKPFSAFVVAFSLAPIANRHLPGYGERGRGRGAYRQRGALGGHTAKVYGRGAPGAHSRRAGRPTLCCLEGCQRRCAVLWCRGNGTCGARALQGAGGPGPAKADGGRRDGGGRRGAPCTCLYLHAHHALALQLQLQLQITELQQLVAPCGFGLGLRATATGYYCCCCWCYCGQIPPATDRTAKRRPESRVEPHMVNGGGGGGGGGGGCGWWPNAQPRTQLQLVTHDELRSAMHMHCTLHSVLVQCM